AAWRAARRQSSKMLYGARLLDVSRSSDISCQKYARGLGNAKIAYSDSVCFGASMAEIPASLTVLDLLDHFKSVLRVDFQLPADLMNEAQAAIDGCKDWSMYSAAERECSLLALANDKLKLNRERSQQFLNAAAHQRIFLNYHDKTELL